MANLPRPPRGSFHPPDRLGFLHRPCPGVEGSHLLLLDLPARAQPDGALEVPAEVFAALRPDRGEAVLRWLERHLVSGLFALTACPSVRMDQLLWEGAVRPGRSGHGGVRPWSRSQTAHAAFAEDIPGRGLRKLAYHLEHLRAWRIYLRCIFQLPSPSGSPLGVKASEKSDRLHGSNRKGVMAGGGEPSPAHSSKS